MNITEIFDNYKSIAVVGMSKNATKPSNSVPVFMKNQGYNIIPVNPSADEIEGMKCWSALADVPEKIDIVNVFRPSDAALEVVKEAVQRKISNGDISAIWLQEGIINDEAKALAEANSIEFIQNKCMYKEYVNVK
ncbi:MAG: CoA-binding protein [Candidatus Kapabacteria bacterium]|nr:CoA-binding protein [Candidatus Kapabacteria bacterium]